MAPEDDASDAGVPAESCGASNLDDIPDVTDDENALFHEKIQFDKEWGKVLLPPSEIMNPITMCAVNQFVQIKNPVVDPFVSTSCELVLVCKGNQVPDTFRMMIYAMDCLNKVSSLKGCFVPHTGLTRALTNVTGKTKNAVKFDVIGIERVLVPDESKQDETRTNFIETEHPIPTFRARCAKARADKQVPCYARVNPVEMQWGILPVEYTVGPDTLKNKRRMIFQVLRVIPQPGFSLMDAVRRKFIDKRNEIKSRDERMISDVCFCLKQIVNAEADNNYGMEGGWDIQNPDPWAVNQPMQPTSVEAILSPFTVLERILHHIKGGYSGRIATDEMQCVNLSSLKIGGFPYLGTAENAQRIIDEYQVRHQIYLKKLCCFYKDFMIERENFNVENYSFAFTPVLRLEESDAVRNLNGMDLQFQMFFTLGNFMKFAERREFREAERFMFPKAAVACLDFFLFNKKSVFGQATNEDKRKFVLAHVGDQLFYDKVTETKIAAIYRVCSEQSLVDFPKACQSKAARDSLRKHLQDSVGDKVAADEMVVQLYESHMLLQLTTTMNGLALDQWMSDRVYYAACLVNQLCVNDGSNPCSGVRAAKLFLFKDCGLGATRDLVAHDESAMGWCMLNAALCRLNKTVCANPLNLNLIWAVIKGDTLTFLGLHNETWRWIMYCVMVASCYGHLRASTQDGHAKSEEVPLTAKPNSVGLNEVVVKTVNFCFEGLLASLVPLSEGERRALRFNKCDRSTRAGMEDKSAVQFSNGRIVSKPMASELMQAVLFDEALRSANKELLDGLTTTALPRDSNAGEGTTSKLLKPERGGAYEKGETKQLPGMGWYVLCFASNTNAVNAIIGEIIGTLAKGAMLIYPPGAPQSMGLASTLTVRDKRKRGQATRSAMWTGESMMPTSMDERQHLAYILSVCGIYSRHLGLMNKSAHSDWEISTPVYIYLDWFKKYFMEHFSCKFSAYLGESCDRIMKGVIARGVAGCHMSTVLCNLDKENDSHVEDKTFHAMYASMMAMEASALTLYWANLAMLNGITHVVDSKLVLVNQLIRWKCQVPVLPIEFLEIVMQPMYEEQRRALEEVEWPHEYEVLKTFLERIKDVRARSADNPNEPIRHFQGNYIQVPGVGTTADYTHIESYLLRFCGVNTGCKHTYLQMFQEVAAKCIDLTAVLDMTRTMLDVKTLFQNFRVDVGSACDSQPGGYHHKGNTYLIRALDPEDAKAATPTGKTWVHINQLLVVASLIGDVELHADNSIHMGRNIFKLIANKTIPQQAVPSMTIVMETFAYKQGDVIADHFYYKTKRQYFFRPQVCYKAWKSGEIQELNCIVGKLPLEDTIHIHAWVQVHTTLVRRPPVDFYYIPMKMHRPPELIPGRVYPLKGEGRASGVICLCPEGFDVAIIRVGDVNEAVGLDMWPRRLNELGMQVGPLVYRWYAAVKLDGKLGVLVKTKKVGLPAGLYSAYDKIHRDITEDNFLRWDGKYSVYYFGATEFSPIKWETVHSNIVVLGHHIKVSKEDLASHVERSKIQADYVIGWLRYPDDCHDTKSKDFSVWVAFRVAHRDSLECGEVQIVGLPLNVCHLVEGPEDRAGAVDYILP